MWRSRSRGGLGGGRLGMEGGGGGGEREEEGRLAAFFGVKQKDGDVVVVVKAWLPLARLWLCVCVGFGKCVRAKRRKLTVAP